MLGTGDKFVVSEEEKGPVICGLWIRWNGRVRYIHRLEVGRPYMRNLQKKC